MRTHYAAFDALAGAESLAPIPGRPGVFGYSLDFLASVYAGEWTDSTTPRTDRPPRFCYLTGAALPPCIARTYGQYARPTRFPLSPEEN